MAGRRVVVGSTGAAGDAAAEARRRRDEGQEVVLLGDELTVAQLAHAAVAEDAAEVVVIGSAQDAKDLEAWLAEHALPGVTVRHAPA